MSLNIIKGIGIKSQNILNKISIYNLEDLVTYYPYRYNFYNLSDLRKYNDEEKIIVKATIESVPKLSYIKKNLNKISFSALSSNIITNVIIFNRAFLKQNLIVGREIYLIGKYDKMKNNFIAFDLKFKLPNSLIEPIYHLITGLKNSQINKWIIEALKLMTIKEIIPQEINDEYHFITRELAINYLHDPQNIQEIKQAKLKLIYEELFCFTFKMNYLKAKRLLISGKEKQFADQEVKEFIKTLPFSLTEDQLKASQEIWQDLKSERKMNRLIIGDVGSGKTIVGFIAVYANYLAGYQSAFMAPTEILALQHYQNLLNTFQKYTIRIELLTGSMSKKQKENIIQRLSNKEIDILIGTHTLIQESVSFANLGLVITDEQHRFGVNQRKLLQAKGDKVDALYLSATPIPRTYALALYGDLDVSLIKTKPKGRKEVFTCLKKEKELKEVLQKVYGEIKLNHQIFAVSPLIDEDENLESVLSLKKKFLTAFPQNVKISILHGKLKNTERLAIMNDFKNNKIQILISTTIVEVGVDISNATMMIIFNAERFGLATIHQLRGRVGRNDLDSSCYLISNFDKERLHVLEESSDGFYITEKDLELRKEGEFFGSKQSGTINFKLADIYRDGKILFQAKKDSEKYINSKKYVNNYYFNDIIKQIDYLD